MSHVRDIHAERMGMAHVVVVQEERAVRVVFFETLVAGVEGAWFKFLSHLLYGVIVRMKGVLDPVHVAHVAIVAHDGFHVVFLLLVIASCLGHI